MDNGVLTDVEIIARKQKEITRARLFQAGLGILVVVLIGVIATLAILSRISEPAAAPRVDVITENTKLAVPDVITVGEPFTYTTKGTKNFANSADVRLQTVCIVNGNEIINSFSTFYSTVPKGKYELARTTSLTVTARTLNSDHCVLQSIADYTFYLIDGGIERSFNVKEFNESNVFRLVVPEVSKETTTAQPAVASLPQPVVPQPQQMTPQETPTPTQVPEPTTIEPTPPPATKSCLAGLPVQNVLLLGGLLCR